MLKTGRCLVNTPPIASWYCDNGVTSRRTTSFTSPVITPPWIAAPIATTFVRFNIICLTSFSFNSFNNGRDTSWTTDKDDSSIWQTSNLHLKGLDELSFCTFCTKITSQINEFGNEAKSYRESPASSPAVMNGKLILCWSYTRKPSFLAFSAAKRWRAILSGLTSQCRFLFWILLPSNRWFWSKSSPPSLCYPCKVANTSKTPSPTRW